VRIASNQSVQGVSVTTGGDGYTAAPSVGFPLPISYQNILRRSGSGFNSTSALTTSATVATNGSRMVLSSTVAGLPVTGDSVRKHWINVSTAGTVSCRIYGGTTQRTYTIPTFTLVAARGRVVSIIPLAGGTGWLVQPDSIKFTLTTGGSSDSAVATFPAGSLAQATAVLTNGTVNQIRVTNGGLGYFRSNSIN